MATEPQPLTATVTLGTAWGDLVIVPEYTGPDPHEMSHQHLAVILSAREVFDGARVTAVRFAKESA